MGASIVVQWGQRKVGVRTWVSIALLQWLAVTLSLGSCSYASSSSQFKFTISSAKTQSIAAFK